MGLFRALTIGAFIFAVPLALLTTNVRVAISEKTVYDYSVRHYGAEEAAGIPESELLRANEQIRDYLLNDRTGALSITVLDKRGDTVSLFGVRETAHMADVRDLVSVLFLVQALAIGAVLTLAVIMLALWPPRALAAAALSGSALTAAMLALASLVSLSGFDAAWSQFHGIAFANDFWQLDPDTDHLIQMFPESFWFDITMLVGAVTVLEALVISAASLGYMMVSRPGDDSTPKHELRRSGLRPPFRQRRRPIAPPDPRHYLR